MLPILTGVVGVVLGMLIYCAVFEEHVDPGWSCERILTVVGIAIFAFFLGAMVSWGLTME